MDNFKYKEIKRKLKVYDDRLEVLKQLETETNNKRQEVCDGCSHDFILAYKKDNMGFKVAGCLVCGEYLMLDNNVDIFSDKELDNNSILDVTEITSLYSQNLLKGDNNVLFLKAKEVFEEYLQINTMNYTRGMILRDIYYKIKDLDEYYASLEKERKQDKEGKSKKKK